MTSRLLAFAVWAAVAASAMFWILRWVGGQAGSTTSAVTAAADAPRGDWARVFGVVAAPAADAPAVAQDPAAASRFKLLGVAAPRWASISVDGKPPSSLALGARIDGQWVVQGIQAKEVRLGPPGEAAVVTLTLAGLPPAATGTLPSVSANPGAAVASTSARGAVPPPVPVGVPADAMAPGPVIAPPVAPALPKAPGRASDGSEDDDGEPAPVLPTLTR
jgi:general secretion pathway protein C